MAEGEASATQTPDVLHATVVDAFYRRRLAAPDTARQRAQSAYTIAGAAAAALVAAGAVADLGTQPLWIRMIGILALVAWIAAVCLFVWVVAVPYRVPEPEEVRGREKFLNFALTAHEEEKQEIDRRQRFAIAAAAIAAILTLGAIGAVLFVPRSDSKQARIALGATAQNQLAALCGHRMPTILTGTVRGDPPRAGFVAIELPPARCLPRPTTAIIEARGLSYVFPSQ